MERKTFTYRSRKNIIIWTLLAAAPFIILVPKFLEFIEGPFYWVANILIMLILWTVIFPQIDKSRSTTERTHGR